MAEETRTLDLVSNKTEMGNLVFLGLMLRALTEVIFWRFTIVVETPAWSKCLLVSTNCNTDNASDLVDKDTSDTQVACINMWTDESPVFRVVQHALVPDHRRRLSCVMPLIRGINAWLVSHPPASNLTTYRGALVPLSELAKLGKGRAFRAAHFLASSQDREVALNFINQKRLDAMSQARVLIRFSVPQGCFNGSFIARNSVYQEEQELLLPPYTMLTCRSIQPGTWDKTLSWCP